MIRVADRPAKDKRAELPRERQGGRFITAYSPEIALQIVEQLAEGKTLKEICEGDPKFPHHVTFKRWVVNNPTLAKAVDAARTMSAMSLEEEALDAAREIKKAQRDGTQVRAFEVLLAQLRWSAERRDPALFGNKTAVSVRVPITINTTLDMGAINTGQYEGKSIYNLEARVNRSPEDAVQDAKFKEIEAPVVPAKDKGNG